MADEVMIWVIFTVTINEGIVVTQWLALSSWVWIPALDLVCVKVSSHCLKTDQLNWSL